MGGAKGTFYNRRRVPHFRRHVSISRASRTRKFDFDNSLTRAPLGTTEKPWNEADIERLIALVDDAAP